MKTTTIAAFLAALLLAATVAACIPLCPCGEWGNWKVGHCGPNDDCCQQMLIWHRHGSRVCPPTPTPTPAPIGTSFVAPYTAECNVPARAVAVEAYDGRVYGVRVSYMGYVDHLTVWASGGAGDDGKTLVPFKSSVSGMGTVSLTSIVPLVKTFEYEAVKDETSTPGGWTLRADLIDMTSGDTVDSQSTVGADTCLHVLYGFWTR